MAGHSFQSLKYKTAEHHTKVTTLPAFFNAATDASCVTLTVETPFTDTMMSFILSHHSKINRLEPTS